jgi:hypothetical protein
VKVNACVAREIVLNDEAAWRAFTDVTNMLGDENAKFRKSEPKFPYVWNVIEGDSSDFIEAEHMVIACTVY